MGPLEIVVILLIAFIVLGPDRMVEAARFLGRMVGEGRRLASDMPRVVVEDDDIKVVNAGETISVMGDAPDRKPAETAGDDSRNEQRPEDDGPVAFTPASEPVPTDAESAEDNGPVAFTPASESVPPDAEVPQSSKRDKTP